MVAFDDNGKIDILGLLPDELEAEILKLGEKKFRAGQIFDWLHVKRVPSFDEMTNLSVQLRNLLNEKFCLKSLFVSKKLESHTDNTVKYLYELEDGNHVESCNNGIQLRKHHLRVNSGGLQNGLSLLCVNYCRVQT